jgi:hypothetical protein
VVSQVGPGLLVWFVIISCDLPCEEVYNWSVRNHGLCDAALLA